MNFEDTFISESKPYKGCSKRDKFLSRVFGIFNEEIIRIWCENEKSPFTNLGRPTIYDNDDKHYTLDFLLKDKNGRVFVTEMKCEIEYQKYKYLELVSPTQLVHHSKKRSFSLFLELSNESQKYLVRCNASDEFSEITGTALVWGKVSAEGHSSVQQQHNISHIISLESVINDLQNWSDESFFEFVHEYRGWSEELFSGLLGKYA
ncbi:hypothetical protein [Vibrio hyugaensis]|uniref:hypothetical protein n=1 Tax=Vibrio hyugaensis TaxID=1534743 RepID=UPI0006937421|nr:hypothetical protein [Vibrio hyugaensis]